MARLPLVLVAALLGACDPGGAYHVPGGIPQGRSYVLGATAQTSLLTHATWFTTSLDVTLAITNRGTTPLEVRPDAATASDREGLLERNGGQFRCANREGDSVTLGPGETCEIEMAFHVAVDKARLSKVTLAHAGVTRGGVAVPIHVIYLLD